MITRKKKFTPRKTNKNKFSEPKKCRFCKDDITFIDYKDVPQLQKLTNSQGKLFSRKRSGNCGKHQRMAKVAVKRSRFIALIPYL